VNDNFDDEIAQQHVQWMHLILLMLFAFIEDFLNEINSHTEN